MKEQFKNFDQLGLETKQYPKSIDSGWNQENLVNKTIQSFLKEELQPKSTHEILADNLFAKDIFSHIIEIQQKVFLFSSSYEGSVLALVQDDVNNDIFRPRYFRISSSDNQFKVHSGVRFDGSLMKGNEEDIYNHYAQSDKLHPDVLMALQSLPVIKTENQEIYKIVGKIRDCLPKITSDNPRVMSRPEDFSPSEKQLIFKNELWNNYRDIMIENYYYYIFINSVSDIRQTSANNLYEYLIRKFDNSIFKMLPNSPIRSEWYDTLKNHYENLTEEEKQQKYVSLAYGKKQTLSQLEFVKSVNHIISETIEKLFRFDDEWENKVLSKINLIPDFSRQPVRKYCLTGSGCNILIEEYDHVSPEGDRLRWAMAQDSEGHVYVNNIYSPDVGIDSYGTSKFKTNFGLLVYKPVDYYMQTAFMNPKYLNEYKEYYNDISHYLELQYPIRKYKEALTMRNKGR